MSCYGVPDPPPVVPPGFNPENYVTRLNRVANRFEIHPRSQGNFSQLGFASIGPIAGESELRVGPPSRAPDWHPLLEKWGLQLFSAAGFINSTAYRGVGEGQMPVGRLAAAAGNGPIHPLLRQDMWQGLRAGEYALMEPAIRLASAILDDPDTLRFFAGLMVPSDQMPCVYLPHIGKCPIFGPSQPLDATAQMDVYQKIMDMRRLMIWRMEDMDTMLGVHDALGLTKPGLDIKGKVCEGARGPGTRSSVIQMSRGYVDAVRMYTNKDPTVIGLGRFVNDTQYLASMPLEDTILIDEDSVLARSTILFVDTLIHELAHAISGAYFDVTAMVIPGMPKHSHVYEPFFAGDRSNEAGHAISSYIFRGNPSGICQWNIPQDISSSWIQQHIAPLGLWWPDQWDRWLSDGGYNTPARPRAVTAVDLGALQRITPVPQAHINKMFSTHLWRDEIYRFGLEAIRMPQMYNWSAEWTPVGMTKGNWGMGRNRWNDGPAPTPPPPPPPPPPSPSNNSDDGGVALYSDAGGVPL